MVQHGKSGELERLRKRVAELENLELVCRAAELHAAESAMRLFTVIERVDEGITFSDEKGHFEIFNSKMGDITGYTMQDVNDHADFIERLYPDLSERQKALARLSEVKDKGKLENIETQIRTRTGTIRTLLVSTVLVRYQNKDMFLTVYNDITERKKMEQLKDEFISMVSHELRTPLSITKEGISLVLDQVPGKINAEQKKILAMAKNNIDRLTRIINELLDISKIESGSLRIKRLKVDLGAIAMEISASFKTRMEEKGLRFVIDVPAHPVELYADSDQMAQIFTNLLANSMKFTREGYITLEICDGEKEVECSVLDTGIGIAQENLSKVFDKFQQFGRIAGPGEKGTGLGLAIVKGIIDTHKGRIRIDSELSKGTKITFCLPKGEVADG